MKKDKIKTLYGSDIEEACLEAARCNLAMLTKEGLISAVDKVLEKEVTGEARRIQLTCSADKILPHLTSPPHCKVFRHDILSCVPKLSEPIDYVFADIPYGIMTEWRTDSSEADPIQSLVRSIAPIMSDDGVLVICGGKDLRLKSDVIRGIDKICIGKRLVLVFQKII